MLNLIVTYAQKMDRRDYVFEVKVAKDQFIKNDSAAIITSSFKKIKLSPDNREIVIVYSDGNEKIFTLRRKRKDELSTYPNNRIYYPKMYNNYYTFTFVRIEGDRYYLNLECYKQDIDIVFQLKEIKD